MSNVQAEYEEAHNGLVAFRKKIFDELAGGMVRSQIDAGHDTIVKFGSVVDRLTIMPYMFNNVKQKAIALRIGVSDIGEGKIAQAKTSFVGAKGSYPLQPPNAVTSRLLPSVGVFEFKPSENILVAEKSNEQVWANLFVLQTDINVFVEKPDVSNTYYSYYKFKPVGRVKCTVTPSSGNGKFNDWNDIKGELTKLVVAITPLNATVPVVYTLWVIVDASYFNTAGECGVVPLIVIIPTPIQGAPSATLLAGGKRLTTDDVGIFAGFVTGGQFAGWTKTHNAVSFGTPVTIWANETLLSIEVNDPLFGTINPPVGNSKHKATEAVVVTATPKSGYIVKEWNLDGANLAVGNSVTVDMYRDHILVCSFIAGTALILRPIADGDHVSLHNYFNNPNWTCVDDVTPDGSATQVECDYPPSQYDLYKFATYAFPPNTVIDSIEVFMRIILENDTDDNKATSWKFVIKSGASTFKDVDNWETIRFGWKVVSKLYSKNPCTASAWTTSEINALQAGLELYLGFKSIDWVSCKCTQVWIQVNHHVPT
jgi:hypothetical protein